MTQATSRVLDGERIERILTRISHEILERNKDAANIVLVSILKGGEEIGRRIAQRLRSVEDHPFLEGSLDITLYRDDLGIARDYPVVGTTDIPFSLEGKDVVLVDDVIFTGRTIRAAMEALMDFGRPARIQLAVLVDRGHRELPIHADYVGRHVPTEKDERVEVHLTADREDDFVAVHKAARAEGD